MLAGGVRAGDVIVLIGSGVIGQWMRPGAVALSFGDWLEILAGAVLGMAILGAAGAYAFDRLARGARRFWLAAAGGVAGPSAAVAGGFLIGVAGAVSPVGLALWSGIAAAGLVAARPLYRFWLERWMRQGKLIANVAVVATSEGGSSQMPNEAEDRGERQLLGIFHTSPAPSFRAGDDVESLARLAQRERVDEVIVSLRCADPARVQKAIAELVQLPVDVRIRLDFGGGAPAVPSPTLLLRRRPLAGWRMAVKRGMDLALGAALVVMFGPLLLLLAALIKMDSPGPVIFRQKRLGFNQQTITVYKFRTMHCGVEDPAVTQARRDDARVTRLGRFLRRSSLDELPQLFNVLAGGMSLVGPRPHAVAHDEKYAALIDGYLARHRVQPGITGWAQVNGFRGETDTLEKMERRIEHDLFYIENWSPLFDLRILALTLWRGFYHQNAY
jgi:Undecaprenyl-phosphate glucose phosphotransferase